jgi:hypothetical protein
MSIKALDTKNTVNHLLASSEIRVSNSCRCMIIKNMRLGLNSSLAADFNIKITKIM